MPPSFPSPSMAAHAAVAPLLLAAAAVAHADVRSEGGGDYAIAPMYRALNYGFIYDSVSGEQQLEGLDYVSNIAPKVNSLETGRIDRDGATAWYTGSAQYSGFYAARTYASLTVENAQADHMYYWVAGQGTTTSVTFYDPAAAAARAVFRWHVSGSSNTGAGGWADGRIDFHATTETGRSWLDLFNGGFTDTLSEYGPGSYSYTMPNAPLGTPIQLFFWTSAFAQVVPGDVADGSDFTITANYSRTIVLEAVELYDGNNNRLTDWTMEDSESGTVLFADGVRFAPVLAPAPIPEPGGWAMLLGGLAAMGGWLRRRQAQPPV